MNALFVLAAAEARQEIPHHRRVSLWVTAGFLIAVLAIHHFIS